MIGSFVRVFGYVDVKALGVFGIEVVSRTKELDQVTIVTCKMKLGVTVTTTVRLT